MEPASGVTDAAFPLLQLLVPLLVVGGVMLIARGNARVVGVVAILVIAIAFVDMVLANTLDARGYHSAVLDGLRGLLRA